MIRMFAFVIVIAVTAALAHGMWAAPSIRPANELIAEAQKSIKAKPLDAERHYALGRIHYLVVKLKTTDLPTWPADPNAAPDAPPRIVSDFFVGHHHNQMLSAEAQKRALKSMGLNDAKQLKTNQYAAYSKAIRDEMEKLNKANWSPPGPSQEEIDKHAKLAMEHLRQAIELAPTNGLYHLDLAGFYETYAPRAAQLEMPPADDKMTWLASPDAVTRWRIAALAEYKAAFELTDAADLKRDQQPAEGLGSLTSHAAATGYIRVAEACEKGNAAMIEAMKTHLKKLERQLPRPMMMP